MMRLGRAIVGERLLGEEEVVDAGIDVVQVEVEVGDTGLLVGVFGHAVVSTLVSVEGKTRMADPGPDVHEVSGAGRRAELAGFA
jgi:hypothetical protein